MTDTNLARRISLGEDSTMEFKRVVLSGGRVSNPHRNELSDELAAFANNRGGTLVLGVDDTTRDVVGIPLEHLDAVERWVCEICNDTVTPPLDMATRKIELPNATGTLVPVVRIDVDRSLFVHRSAGGYVRRIGGSKREMTPEALARLFQDRSQTPVIRFDESLVPRTNTGNLDYSLTRRFLQEDSAEEGVNEILASKLGLVADDDYEVPRLTLAAVLLCTRNPQQWLPHAYIQAVSYAGERADVNSQSEARDIGGPLDEQVEEAMHFIRRNMLVGASKTTARADRPQFSERAMFEALVNAVAHRDYSIAGSRIRLRLFRDRIELYVPGGLVNTLSPESLHLRQATRNELILYLLTRCRAPAYVGTTHFIQRRGDGVPIIFNESRELSGRRPEYTVIDDSELQLTIWAAA